MACHILSTVPRRAGDCVISLGRKMRAKFKACLAVLCLSCILTIVIYSYASAPLDFTHLRQLSTETVHLEQVPFHDLLEEYKRKIAEVRSAGYWKANKNFQPCSKEKVADRECVDRKCSSPVATPEQNLHGLLFSMRNTDPEVFALLFDLFGARKTGKRVLFLSAASSDHFSENQGLVENLHNHVFPYVNNYTFVFYDLGLSDNERREFVAHCKCEVRTFPFHLLPWRLQNLLCYTWKAFLVQANLPTSDILIWVDSSIRFQKSVIQEMLQELETKGVMTLYGAHSVAQHTYQTMFDYFDEDACNFAHVTEKQTGLLLFKNEMFVREAIVKPWAACAMDGSCMCPTNFPLWSLGCDARVRHYGKCHRFEQSAINIILAKLFRGYEDTFVSSRKHTDVRKNDVSNYFEVLDQAGYS
ncbi:uncharacterized protein LOC124128294 [Haliotis rufescens]|uniref:uncharacterized protein LOC124128294 n=1 Tax=Haliotis rufescens TaxID=6454 RepID=UPI00201F949F|nr:uncharacterized protein LOC124128294 [Haliotis rufescens]XP_046347635.2 uncharacterized protein LOC124128294 [Haliotis rufescens]XP_046347636.2 uncharacterized protein LOC124128294 [Haliotis rufescens]